MPIISIGDNTDDDIAGCEAIHIERSNPDLNQGFSSTLSLRNDGDEPGQRRDGLLSPRGLDDARGNGYTINAASVIMYSVGSFEEIWSLYILNEDWIHDEVTWNSAATSDAWTNAGAAPPTSRGTTVVGTAPLGDTDMEEMEFVLNSTGIAALQVLLDAAGATPIPGFKVETGDPGSQNAYKHTSADGLRPRVVMDVTAGGGDQIVEPSGIGSAAVFGSHTIADVVLSVAPTGLVSAAVYGSHTITDVDTNFTLLPTGISSAAVYGSHLVQGSTQLIGPSGISSAAVFGDVVVVHEINSEGVPTAVVYGMHTVSLAGAGSQTVTMTGLSTAAVYGTLTAANVAAGAIQPPGRSSAAVFGSHAVADMILLVLPLGITSPRRTGNHVLLGGISSVEWGSGVVGDEEGVDSLVIGPSVNGPLGVSTDE